MTFLDPGLIIKLLSSGGLGTAIGGVAGFLGKAFWVRWLEERALPTAELLNRLECGKLTRYGRARLRNEGRDMLAYWRRSRPVPTEGRKLPAWPPDTVSMQSRPTSYGESGSPCPAFTDPESPLFLPLEKSTLEDLAIELDGEFDRLDKEFPLSKALISQISNLIENVPRVWVSCLNLWIRERRDVETASQKLSSIVRKSIPGAAIVIEVYAPAGLISSDLAITPGATDIPTRPAARYAWLRDQAANRLSAGVELGELLRADREVPSELIDERILERLRAAIDNPTGWRTIAISGAPGSGKTELARRISSQLVQSERMISIAAVTPSMLETIRALPDQTTLHAALHLLAEAIARDAQPMVPDLFRIADDWKEPFVDALFAIFSAQTQQILLVIDDLHMHSDVSAAMTRMRASAAPYRFLLISRSGIYNPSGPATINYDCKLWSRSQAERMLNHWVSDTNKLQVDRALTNGWPQRQEVFSLYLLRAMAEYIDSLESAPSELLNKTIRGHLSPIAQMLKPEEEPAEAVLERVKCVLANEQATRDEVIRAISERHEVDPVLVMGILAWYTSFAPPEEGAEREHRAFLDADRVLQFSKGLVSSKNLAEQILEVGAKAKIFDKSRGAFRNVYGWRDKLIADGCAALYLASEIDKQRMDGRSIANCVENLDEKQSLDILALAIDATLLTTIIKAITTNRPSLASIVDRLLTPEVVERLSRISGTLEEVGDRLYNLSQVVDMPRLVFVARALARLMRFSESLRQECWDFIRSSSSNRAMTALSAVATECSNTEEFFVRLEAAGLPEFMHPVALDAAARVWNAAAWPTLASRGATLLTAGVSKDRLERIWVVWCALRTTEQVLRTCAGLIQAGLTASNDAFYWLASITLKYAVVNRSPAERLSCKVLFSEIAHSLKRAAGSRHRATSDVVKWLAVQFGPEIADPNTEWTLTSDGASAFPQEPMETSSIADLFQRLRSVREYFRIASGEELSTLRVNGGLELVRDALGDNFSYQHEDLVTGQVRAWNGAEVVIIPKWQVNMGPFQWRPRFSLPA